jgi:hypothetical protein
MKQLVIIIIVLCAATMAYAQDQVHLTKGADIQGKVEKITPSEIEYRSSDNIDGPIHIVKKDSVAYIKYANGKIEWIQQDKEQIGVITNLVSKASVALSDSFLRQMTKSLHAIAEMQEALLEQSKMKQNQSDITQKIFVKIVQMQLLQDSINKDVVLQQKHTENRLGKEQEALLTAVQKVETAIVNTSKKEEASDWKPRPVGIGMGITFTPLGFNGFRNTYNSVGNLDNNYVSESILIPFSFTNHFRMEGILGSLGVTQNGKYSNAFTIIGTGIFGMYQSGKMNYSFGARITYTNGSNTSSKYGAAPIIAAEYLFYKSMSIGFETGYSMAFFSAGYSQGVIITATVARFYF